MSPKENALRIIRFDSPERVVAAPPGRCLAYFGANHESPADGVGHDRPIGSRWTDIWGTGWEKEHAGVMGFPRHHPLADPAALKTYQWPDPDDPRLCKPIHHDPTAPSDGFLMGSHRDTLWEKSYMLVGMENMMDYFFSEPAYAHEILRRIMDFQLGMARHYIQAGIEMALLGDDLGTQIGPLLSPRIVQEFLLPQYRRLFSFYKQRRVLINFHSCGCINAVLDSFLDLGVDILNPVQVTANDLDALRARTQGRIALCGGINSDTLVRGPAERIVAEVGQRLWQLGRQGGYFCGPDQGMPWPDAHYAAYRQALETYGRYPLQPPGQAA